MRRADALVRRSLWAMAVAVLVASLALPTSAFALDHKLKTLADLRGVTIGMVSGGSFDRMMEKNETLQGDVNISYQNSVVDATA